MKVRDRLSGLEGTIVGVIDHDAHMGTRFAIANDNGTWTTQYSCYLSQLYCPDMRITVGHVIDNPTFDFNGRFEITTTDEDGTVRTLYDSDRDDGFVPCELIIETVTYMAINEAENKLRLEVR